MTDDDLAIAASTWNDASETDDSVRRRIHDGVPVSDLERRADHYVARMFRFFEVELPACPECLEIGSGMGYIMEALSRKLRALDRPSFSITGLDIAENMLARAKARLPGSQYKFLHYDGVEVPLHDQSLDLVYSVAALQHVPKPYVYNLFFECGRLMRPGATAVFHFLGFNSLKPRDPSWREEVNRQIGGKSGHWLHFYSKTELGAVLRATGFQTITLMEETDHNVWAAVRAYQGVG